MSSAGVGSLISLVFLFFISPVVLIGVVALLMFIYAQLFKVRKTFPNKRLKVFVNAFLISILLSFISITVSWILIWFLDNDIKLKDATKIPYISMLLRFVHVPVRI